MKFVWIKDQCGGYEPQIWHEPFIGAHPKQPLVMHDVEDGTLTMDEMIVKFPPPKGDPVKAKKIELHGQQEEGNA